MKRLSFLLTFVLFLSACGPAVSDGETVAGCNDTLDGLSVLLAGYEFPQYFMAENPVKQGGEFDVMQYFTVLDHLSMKPGYVLDYVYHYDGMGGYPILYVRPDRQDPYASEADLAAAGENPNYLDYIQADDTPESYFQFAVLAMTGEQFYLFWHAGYSDRRIVCNKADVTDIVASVGGEDFGLPMPLTSRVRAALLTGVEPSVSVGEQTVEVRLVTFTDWGGFYLETYTINRKEPHTIQDVHEKNLVPYECGVMF